LMKSGWSLCECHLFSMFVLLPAAVQGQADCCDKKHDATVDMGFCKFIEVEHRDDGELYRCRIYGTSDLPDLCGQFNCVSWAKANDNYTENNSLLLSAQKALNRLRGKSP